MSEFEKNSYLSDRIIYRAAVLYINDQGGSVISLFEETKSIWLWCDMRNIIISAVHIAGKRNVTADYMSRSFTDSTE